MSNDFEKYNKKTLAGVAKDAEAFAIRDLLAETNRNILCILSDGISLNQVYETLSFLQPEADILNSKTAAEKNIFKHAQKHPSRRET